MESLDRTRIPEQVVGPDGTRYPKHTLFKEISPFSRLVFDHGDGLRVWFESTVTLQEVAGDTLVTITHVFPDKASRDEVVNKYGAIEGGKQNLAKLEKYLTENLLRIAIVGATVNFLH